MNNFRKNIKTLSSGSDLDYNFGHPVYVLTSDFATITLIIKLDLRLHRKYSWNFLSFFQVPRNPHT